MADSQTITEPEQTAAELSIKGKAYAAMRSEGLKNKEICHHLGISEDYGYKLSSLNNKLSAANSKYSLSSDKMQSKAHKAIDKLMQGKPFGTIDKVKDSTALAAASMVYDRTDPVIKKNMNMNINATVDPVDLSAYMSK